MQMTINKEVLQWLGWTEQDYLLNVLEHGFSYLDIFYDQESDIIDYLAKSEMFWNWWKHFWAKRDEALYEDMKAGSGNPDEIAPHLRHAYYKKIHEPLVLVCEIRPPRVLFGKGFTHLKISA